MKLAIAMQKRLSVVNRRFLHMVGMELWDLAKTSNINDLQAIRREISIKG